MRLIVAALLVFSLSAPPRAHAQSDTTSSAASSAATWTTVGILVPLAIAGTVVSIVPPSAHLIVKNGNAYGGLSFETGIGTGTQRGVGELSDWRLSLGYSHTAHRSINDMLRVEGKRDLYFGPVGSRKIFQGGMHVGAGYLTDFHAQGWSVGSGLWFASPWLAYFGFFPQHTIGLSYRYNVLTGQPHFHEISLGVASTFTF